METPTTTVAAEGSAPAPATAPVAPAPEATPSKPDVKSFMASLSPAQRALAATGKLDQLKLSATPSVNAPAPTPVVVAAAPVEPAASATPPAAEPAAPATSQPETPPATGGESPAAPEGADGEGSKRFRFSSEEDKAVAQIAKARGVSLVEASRLYAGTSQPVATPAAASAPEATPAADPVVVSFESEITEAQAKIETLAATREQALDDLDHKQASKLSDDIAEAKAALRLAEHKKQERLQNVQRESETAQQRQLNAARDRVFQEFPVFADADGMERLALDAYVNRALTDPARKAEFKDPNWPVKIAQEFAAKKGIKPKAVGAAPAAPVAPAATTPAAPKAIAPLGIKSTPQQVTGPRLLTGAEGARAPEASRPLTRERALELVRTNSEARRAIVRQLNTNSVGR